MCLKMLFFWFIAFIPIKFIFYRSIKNLFQLLFFFKEKNFLGGRIYFKNTDDTFGKKNILKKGMTGFKGKIY